MKRRIRLCAALLTGILALAGCSSNNNIVVNYQKTDDNIQTITFFGNKYEPENVTVIEEIISGFMQENPGIRVSYESLKGSEYYEALEKRMAAGKGDDVIMVNHDILLKLEAQNQLEDLSGISTIPEYTGRMLSQMEEDGKIYWVPTTVSAFGLYCNLDLLEEHKQNVPKTLTQWMETCRYFSDQGILPVIANNDISLKTLAIGLGFYPVYQENRQEEVLGRLNQGEEALSQYLTPGFSLVEELIKRGYLDAQKTLKTQKTSDDLQEFIKGESPFMLTGAWAAGRVKSMNPKFQFEVVPYPALEDGSLLVINADTRLSVNAEGENVEAAKKFVEYFTRAENIQKFADQQSSFSPLKGESPSTVKEIQPLVSCYQSDRTVIGTDRLISLPIWELTQKAAQKLLAGEPLSEVMAWMDQEAGQERGVQE